LSWDEIDALTIGRLAFELGSTKPPVDEEQARRRGASRVFDQIRDRFDLSRDELREQPPDRVKGWIAEITGRGVDAATFNRLLLDYLTDV
jgi:hypothetical protein